MEEIKFALDTFYAVMAGALVMWMAAGFTMLFLEKGCKSSSSLFFAQILCK